MKQHTIKFKISGNIKELKEILNSINEEEQEFTVEKLFEMREVIKKIKMIERTTLDYVHITIDDERID